jgi:hypothetical protein
MTKKLSALLTLMLLSVFSLTGVATAAKPSGDGKPSGGGTTTTIVGNDISWPQCGKTLPSGQAFGIVGVNGGLANTDNTCLGSQLVWAWKSTGQTSQAKAQLYVNTANPGGLNTASWPADNIDPAGKPAPNPYGTCDHGDNLACAWQYGWNRAVEDVQQRFIPAAQAAGVDADPAHYPWWLDIETENTWKTGSDFAYQSNMADIEGMVAYFRSVGITKLGIYSTNYQWDQITGSYGRTSTKLAGLDSWLAGARNLKGAQSNCSLSALTANSQVTLTQYVSSSLDYDYSCVN